MGKLTAILESGQGRIQDIEEIAKAAIVADGCTAHEARIRVFSMRPKALADELHIMIKAKSADLMPAVVAHDLPMSDAAITAHLVGIFGDGAEEWSERDKRRHAQAAGILVEDNVVFFSPSDDTVFSINWRPAGPRIEPLGVANVTLSLISRHRAVVEEAKRLCVEAATEIRVSEEPQRTVFMLLKSPVGDIEFMPIGNLDTDWTPLNYSPAVREGFNYIVEQFNKDKPAGRVAVFNGLPGTGKTRFIEALTGHLRRQKIIYWPVQYVDLLSGPELASMLRDEFASGERLLLVIEDGDETLLKRGAENRSKISTLLNMTDGIPGRLFDLRVIVTTNAETIELDSAIMRPGRLLKHVEFDRLPADEANKRAVALSGNIEFPETVQSHTLGEIYQAVGEGKWADA